MTQVLERPMNIHKRPLSRAEQSLAVATRLAGLHRDQVYGYRQLAIEKGFTNRNDLIAKKLAQIGIPHAIHNIDGRPTDKTHPGLTGIYGVLRKNIIGERIQPAAAIELFAQNVNFLTPDASNQDRREIVVSALQSLHLGVEATGMINESQHPIVDVFGIGEVALPLTPNLPAYEQQNWHTPYILLDFLKR